ncbi:MAG TPA: sn-glycerol-1-phosphate dehydrogenase [Clostridiales bacterium]|nr:sn-glycerol-1-phosphate dehydrogenase [Clostridiales bacterium]
MFPKNPLEYKGRQFCCKCGKTHSFNADIILGKNILPKEFSKDTLIICDSNTLKCAGNIKGEKFVIGKSVESAKINFVRHIIDNMPKDIITLAALGSGTICDITRYAAHLSQKHFVALATAPSMDGYLSVVSPIVFENYVKRSMPSKAPKKAYCDIDILSAAPMRLILAGLGDILGKFTSLIDWKIANLVEDCYYCPEIAELVKYAVELCYQNSQGLKDRDNKSIMALIDALLLCGIAMNMAGFSRPASGAEHTLAHYFEIEVLKNKAYGYHGEFVGIGMLIYARLLNMFFEKKPNMLSKKFEKLMDSWYSIKDEVTSLNDRLEQIESAMKDVGCKTKPSEIGIDKKALIKALLTVRPSMPKYTSITLLRDFGKEKELINKYIEKYL